MGAAAEGTGMEDQVLLEQHRICPRLSVGTEAVVPPPGGDSETRTVPEVKE